MTHYHVFQAVPGIQVAVTSDSTGRKLPKPQSGGWYPMRTLTVKPGGGPLIDADSDEVIAAIERDGYFLWPKTVQP